MLKRAISAVAIAAAVTIAAPRPSKGVSKSMDENASRNPQMGQKNELRRRRPGDAPLSAR